MNESEISPNSIGAFEPVRLPTIAIPAEYPASKLPTFVAFQPQVYEPETLQLSDVTQFEEEDQTVASARVACTARWKLSSGDSDKRTLTYEDMASNTNLVQWSDDSYSIVIGAEIYDLNIHPVGKDEHIHVFAQHQSASLMEDVGSISQKMFVRPVGSTTNIANRVSRTQAESKVKMAFMPQDPEAARIELEKIAIEKQKIKQKQNAEQKRYEQKQMRKEYASPSYLTKEWLEEDAGKFSTKKKEKRSLTKEDEDEEDEEEDDDFEDEYDEEDDDNSYESTEEESEDTDSENGLEEELDEKKTKRPTFKRKVLSDDDD